MQANAHHSAAAVGLHSRQAGLPLQCTSVSAPRQALVVKNCAAAGSADWHVEQNRTMMKLHTWTHYSLAGYMRKGEVCTLAALTQ